MNYMKQKMGKKVFDLYNKYHPDIILTDINMPKMDGLTLIKKIRKFDNTIKIIISTAFSEKDYLMDAIDLKLEKYIIKPLTSRNLIPALTIAVKDLEKESDLEIPLGKGFYFDKSTSLFYLNDIMLELNKKELLFLKLLVLNRNRVVSYLEIEQYVWEDEYMSLNSLRTTIGFFT